MEWQKDVFLISTDKTKLVMDTIKEFLGKTYWANLRSEAEIKKSIEHSLCYGVYTDEQQVGFARVITDYVSVYYLSDVFIAETYRGRGLAKWLVECIINTPDINGLKGVLFTKDAQGLYKKFDFVHPKETTVMIKTPAGKVDCCG